MKKLTFILLPFFVYSSCPAAFSGENTESRLSLQGHKRRIVESADQVLTNADQLASRMADGCGKLIEHNLKYGIMEQLIEVRDAVIDGVHDDSDEVSPQAAAHIAQSTAELVRLTRARNEEKMVECHQKIKELCIQAEDELDAQRKQEFLVKIESLQEVARALKTKIERQVWGVEWLEEYAERTAKKMRSSWLKRIIRYCQQLFLLERNSEKQE